jgi:hypothetical protein
MSSLHIVGHRHTTIGIDRVRWVILALSAAGLGVACASQSAPAGPPPDQTAIPSQAAATVAPDPTPAAGNGGVAGDGAVIDDGAITNARAATGDGRSDATISSDLSQLNPAGPKEFDQREFFQLLPRDVIAPVYSPEYRTARQVVLDPNDLVIGVSIAGEHRAYPIKALEFSEMVNDDLGRVPILVTW